MSGSNAHVRKLLVREGVPDTLLNTTGLVVVQVQKALGVRRIKLLPLKRLNKYFDIYCDILFFCCFSCGLCSRVVASAVCIVLIVVCDYRRPTSPINREEIIIST